MSVVHFRLSWCKMNQWSILISGLMENSQNIGSAVRSLIELPRPKEEAERTNLRSNLSSKRKSPGKSDKVSQASSRKSSDGEEKDVGACGNIEDPTRRYNHFNVVVYGLPNFVTSFWDWIWYRESVFFLF